MSASGHPATNGSPYFASGCPARLSLLFALQGSCFGLCGQSLDFAHTIWTSGQIRDLTHLPTIAGIVHKTRHCLLVQFAHNTTTSTATIKKKKKLHAHCSKSVVCLIIPLSFFRVFILPCQHANPQPFSKIYAIFFFFRAIISYKMPINKQIQKNLWFLSYFFLPHILYATSPQFVQQSF